VLAVTDASEAVVEKCEYMPYGSVTIKDGQGTDLNGVSAIKNPYTFTARRYDEETGLYHYRHRAYDPVAGRFLQRDPLGYVDGPSLHAYAGSRPTCATDPWGLAPNAEDIIGGAEKGAAIGGAAIGPPGIIPGGLVGGLVGLLWPDAGASAADDEEDTADGPARDGQGGVQGDPQAAEPVEEDEDATDRAELDRLREALDQLIEDIAEEENYLDVLCAHWSWAIEYGWSGVPPPLPKTYTPGAHRSPNPFTNPVPIPPTFNPHSIPRTTEALDSWLAQIEGNIKLLNDQKEYVEKQIKEIQDRINARLGDK
jgi:RHS repeat-associated protein